MYYDLSNVSPQSSQSTTMLGTNKRSLSENISNKYLRHSFTLFCVISLAIKVYALIVFFSRMRLQVFYLSPNDRSTEFIDTFLIDFSFGEMIRDFWHAKAYFVAVVICSGSCIIPICKHVYMLIAWYLPMRGRAEDYRRVGLFFFDQIGRTALVDLFLLGYVICVFYTRVDEVIQLGYGVRIQMSGEPVRGIFAGILSTFTSSFCSHFLLVCHDAQKMENFELVVTVASGGEKCSLFNRLLLDSSSSTRSRRKNLCLGVSVTLLLISSCLMLLITIVGKPLVSFRMAGLAGIVSDAEFRDFYLLTAPQKMAESSPNQVGGVNFLGAIYVAVTVVIPFMLLLVSLVLWLIPLRLKVQRAILVLYPFWFSWSAVDVLLVTTIAAYLELHLIAQFTFDNKFKSLCSFIKNDFKISCVELDHSFGEGLVNIGIFSMMLFLVFVSIDRLGAKLLETSPKVFAYSFDTPRSGYFYESRPLERESPLIVA